MNHHDTEATRRIVFATLSAAPGVHPSRVRTLTEELVAALHAADTDH